MFAQWEALQDISRSPGPGCFLGHRLVLFEKGIRVNAILRVSLMGCRATPIEELGESSHICFHVFCGGVGGKSTVRCLFPLSSIFVVDAFVHICIMLSYEAASKYRTRSV